jgi:hypothetical protein
MQHGIHNTYVLSIGSVPVCLASFATKANPRVG